MKTIKKIVFAFAFVAWLFLNSCSKKRTEHGRDEKAMENDSLESVSVLRIQAGIAYEKDQFEVALKSYGKLVALDSMDSIAVYRYAYCNARLSRDSVAVKYWLKSAELNYRIFESYQCLGVLYFGTNNLKSAFYFNKCLDIKKDDKEIKHFLYLINKGKTNV